MYKRQLVYRRDIAKDVFGTDDPEAVGEKLKDWDTTKATAEELKAKGYYTFASYADTFRLYGNSIENSWVEPGSTTVKVDQKIMDWISDSKEWLDAGYPVSYTHLDVYKRQTADSAMDMDIAIQFRIFRE